MICNQHTFNQKGKLKDGLDAKRETNLYACFRIGLRSDRGKKKIKEKIQFFYFCEVRKGKYNYKYSQENLRSH